MEGPQSRQGLLHQGLHSRPGAFTPDDIATATEMNCVSKQVLSQLAVLAEEPGVDIEIADGFSIVHLRQVVVHLADPRRILCFPGGEEAKEKYLCLGDLCSEFPEDQGYAQANVGIQPITNPDTATSCILT